MNPFDFIATAIATWYICYVLVSKSGPFRVLERIRAKSGGLLECIYCVAPYVALLLYMLVLHTDFGIHLVQVFGIAGLSMMLRSYTGAGIHV